MASFVLFVEARGSCARRAAIQAPQVSVRPSTPPSTNANAKIGSVAVANIVVLSGVVEKAEDRYTDDNKRIVKFRMKTVEHFKGKEYSDWHNVEIWSDDVRVAEGDYVVVVGKKKTNSYEKDGVKQQWHYVRASSVEVLGGHGAPPSQDPGPVDDDSLPF